VRIPLFPVYSEFRHLLRVWPGFPRKQVTGLRATVNELRGTPQNTVDWTDPATWIPERLQGGDRELAQAIWDRSKGTVNPRHTYGHWLLAQKYELLREGDDGVVQLTSTGRDFLDNPGGEAEAALDEAEGLIKLLSIVADNGPARAGGLLEEWSDYLTRRSSFGTDSTRKDTLRRRLKNLLERRLVERKGNLYSVTQDGLAYLQRTGDEDSVGGADHHELWALVRQQENTVRESLRELLCDMDPFAFEHLIKRLLEEMDYQNVEVTSRSGDGGVDVVADIELGITSVREVVQAKRHRRPIQRKDLDALRGSLYRFNAVRGTIVSTARFARGTQDAAFATGAAPITLIDGDKLIDLLIEHGIGIRKRPIEMLEVDAAAFASTDGDA
jgi:restriction system protein